jgi:hypothetical protein
MRLPGTLLKRGLCFVFSFFAIASESFALSYRVDLDFFRKASNVSRYYGTVEKVEWNGEHEFVVFASRRTFDISYDIRPQLKPVAGMKELILRSESLDAETVELSVKEFPNGRYLKFKEKWSGEMSFKTGFDPCKLYQIRTIRVTCKQRRSPSKDLRKIVFRSLTAVYDSSESQALSVDVETGNPFHCVRDELGEVPKLRIRNISQSPISMQGSLSLESSLGEKIPFDVLPVTVNAGDVKLLSIPTTASKGVWHVRGELFAGDGSTNVVETRFARIDCHRRTPAVPRGTFRMGINYHMASYSQEDKVKTLAAFVATGAKLARAGIGLTMKSVQKNGPDDWDWGRVDEWLDMLDAAGLRASSGPGTMPKWSVRPDAIAKAKETKDWRWEVITLPRDNLFERFCEKMAERFKGRLDYYEIGNEWDLNFRHPVSEAVEIQRQAYRGIKRFDPDVCVLPNGWAGANDLRATRNTPRANFQKEFLLLSKGDCYDVHPTHCHGDFASYERRIDSLMKLRKDTGTDFRPWFSNESAISSWRGEREPAATVWKKIVFARAHGSVDYIWYNLRGTSWDPKDPEQGYGMLTAGYLPRETFVSFASLATLMKGQRFSRSLVRRGKRHIYEFSDGKSVTLIGWDAACKTGDASVLVQTDASEAEYVDMFGNRKCSKIVNGMIDFKIGDNPSALVLKNGTWMQLDAGTPKPQTQSGLVHVADIPNVENCGKAHFVLSNPSQITEFFEAIPGKENRLWKGKDDLSAEIRLKNRGDALMVRISVRDDRHIPVKIGSLNTGDFIQAVVRSSVGGKSQSINFSAPKSCSEGVSDYEACVPWSSLGAKNGKVPEYIIFEILIEDDDGLGRECAMGIEKKVD